LSVLIAVFPLEHFHAAPDVAHLSAHISTGGEGFATINECSVSRSY